MFRDNRVAVGDNATIQRKSREKDLSMRKRGLKADVCGRMIKKERKGERERCSERQRTGMVVADASSVVLADSTE